MKPQRAVLLVTVIALASCGRVADLKPAAGKPLPVKPLMARATPTAQELLTLPPYAKPDRIDELVTKSQPRQPDPFNLPPATGGAAPSLPVGENPEAAPARTGSVTPGD